MNKNGHASNCTQLLNFVHVFPCKMPLIYRLHPSEMFLMAFKKDVVLEKKQNILSVVAPFLNFAMGDSKFSSRRLAPAKEKKT